MAITQSGRAGLIFCKSIQAEDEVSQDYLGSREKFGLDCRIFGFSYLSKTAKDRPQAKQLPFVHVVDHFCIPRLMLWRGIFRVERPLLNVSFSVLNTSLSSA